MSELGQKRRLNSIKTEFPLGSRWQAQQRALLEESEGERAMSTRQKPSPLADDIIRLLRSCVVSISIMNLKDSRITESLLMALTALTAEVAGIYANFSPESFRGMCDAMARDYERAVKAGAYKSKVKSKVESKKKKVVR